MFLALTASAGACRDPDPVPEREPASQGAKVTSPHGPVEIVPAPPDGEVADVVRAEQERTRSRGRSLVVYVGAVWCEPCTHFHEAAARGELDGRLPGITLLEFDLDRDRDRLQRAGYASRMIPLLALPKPDGTASDLRMAGSIKGTGAPGEMVPRLAALLARASEIR
jgi:hypothetical protein